MKQFALTLPLEQLAAIAEGKLIKIRECTCNAVASLEEADENTVVFFQDTKFEKAFAESKAGIFLIPEKLDLNTLPKRNYILCSKPYFSFLRIVAYFLQSTQKPVKGRDIHPTAIVAESVIIPDNITIAANAVIGENVVLGDYSSIHENVVIKNDVVIGERCCLFPGVIIYSEVQIGCEVSIHAGSVIGSDGFGYIWDGKKHQKIPQVGRVIIEDDVEIGANVSIDRGALGDTIIRKGSKIDNLVQIAHNVEVGEYSILCSQVGIAGSSKVGNNCIFAGQVGIADHVKIGNNVKIGAQSGVPNDIPDNKIVLGYPAIDIGLQRRILASLKELPDMRKYFHRLKKEETNVHS
ncbi:MAG: UDP-3-O-(3-hydroxymyristoyl)glucosamine N-acyltransferase [Candidatus Celaenobacter antarcticus]|nr:UDP-3-O-(3-hydroxymyristoyl)glucosamine N-acyltransferase [Candidatus Celaenobacter antarcticus]